MDCCNLFVCSSPDAVVSLTLSMVCVTNCLYGVDTRTDMMSLHGIPVDLLDRLVIDIFSCSMCWRKLYHALPSSIPEARRALQCTSLVCQYCCCCCCCCCGLLFLILLHSDLIILLSMCNVADYLLRRRTCSIEAPYTFCTHWPSTTFPPPPHPPPKDPFTFYTPQGKDAPNPRPHLLLHMLC